MRRKAFTLLELLIVIVVLGIVSMISSDIITSIYDRYIVNRAIGNLETKTEHALDVIAKRLQYRIKESVIARKEVGGTVTIAALSNAESDYPILEWIGYDDDGLRGKWDATANFNRPGWSGFGDILASDVSSTPIRFESPGSQFVTIEEDLLDRLSNSDVSLNGGADHAAIVFKGVYGDYNVSKYGWNHSGDYNYTIRIRAVDDDTLSLLDKPEFISERYQLAWSAYALVPEGSDCNATTPTDCNLTFYYGFQPWENEEYNSQGTSSGLLIDHITTFRFRQTGRAIHIKLCATDPSYNQLAGSVVSICKERVVY